MEIKKELLELLIKEIKNKSQIKTLEDSYISIKLNKFFQTNGDIKNKINIEFSIKKEKIIKSKEFKHILKNIREEIGKVYGCFLTNEFKKKEKILKKIIYRDEFNKLLKLHKSTRERLEYYPEIYSKIFSWFKETNTKIEKITIADIGCGLNPLSQIYIPKEIKIKNYFCYDLNPSDMEFLNSCFNKFKLNSFANNSDLITLNILKEINFQKADLVFIFKVIDSLEKIKRNISKNLLKKIKSKNIVISFPNKSLVSKEEFKIKRTWIKKFFEEMNWKFEEFKIENELFFLINKD